MFPRDGTIFSLGYGLRLRWFNLKILSVLLSAIRFINATETFVLQLIHTISIIIIIMNEPFANVKPASSKQCTQNLLFLGFVIVILRIAKKIAYLSQMYCIKYTLHILSCVGWPSSTFTSFEFYLPSLGN